MIVTCENAPAGTLVDLRTRILGGAVQPLEQLAGEDLVVMREMLIKGEAEVISSASKPYLIAKRSKPVAPPVPALW